jgi:hypothetical protein
VVAPSLNLAMLMPMSMRVSFRSITSFAVDPASRPDCFCS